MVVNTDRSVTRTLGLTPRPPRLDWVIRIPVILTTAGWRLLNALCPVIVPPLIRIPLSGVEIGSVVTELLVLWFCGTPMYVSLPLWCYYGE